jgi:hypothetical protein
MLNRVQVVAFTNDPLPITLPTQDRRWFCVWSRAPRMTKPEADALWDWYKAGGYEKIAAWLHLRDVSAFGAAAAPPVTEWKLNMVEQGMSVAESYLVDMMRLRVGPFASGVRFRRASKCRRRHCCTPSRKPVGWTAGVWGRLTSTPSGISSQHRRLPEFIPNPTFAGWWKTLIPPGRRW